ncbi:MULTISPECIES: ATP-binding protein [Aphanothece]|uniref:ATP-binding protein n=1 Tax=Aphanothece TaxID=1121 RepID=UPI0039848461
MNNDLGPSSSQPSLELPATMDSWDQLMAFARLHAEAAITDSSRVYKLMLAVEELLSNIMRSASGVGGGSHPDDDSLCPVIRISFRRGASTASPPLEMLTISIEDSCPAFDPHLESIPASIADSPIETRQIGGLGLFLVKSSVDQVDYQFKDGRNQYLLSMVCDS